MSKHRKRWSIAEKLEIVKYYQEHGLGKASAEYDVSSTSIYNWEKRLDTNGRETPVDSSQSISNKLKKMEREMKRLKLLVADQALELSIKNDLLKKKSSLK